jgi:hypothetical protein
MSRRGKSHRGGDKRKPAYTAYDAARHKDRVSPLEMLAQASE